jgi:hypothetical protein
MSSVARAADASRRQRGMREALDGALGFDVRVAPPGPASVLPSRHCGARRLRAAISAATRPPPPPRRESHGREIVEAHRSARGLMCVWACPIERHVVERVNVACRVRSTWCGGRSSSPTARKVGVVTAGRAQRAPQRDGRCAKRGELRAENGQDPTALRVPRRWGRYGRSRAARRGSLWPVARSAPYSVFREVGVVMVGRAQRARAALTVELTLRVRAPSRDAPTAT